MPEITDNTDTELRRIAAALVAEAPDAPPLTDVVGADGLRPLTLRRSPHRRGPRLAVAAAVAALALLAGGVIAVTRGGDGTSEPDYGFMAQAGLEPAPQRLIYDDWQNELTADGQVVPLELDGLDAHGPPRPLPDGGHVVVGIRAPAEPVPEDFNEFTDLTFELAVVGAGGEVEVERDLGNEQTTLVGVSPTDALLIRQPEDDRGMKAGPARLVAHDLATGDERVVHQDVSFDPDTNAWARWAVVGTDLVTVAAIEHLPQTSDEGESEEAGELPTPMRVDCTLRINDLTTGGDDERPLDLGCQQVMGLQASPDGSQAAVVYQNDDELPGATYLAVIDLPSGEVVHNELLGERSECAPECAPGAQNIEYHGIAWDDAATVRVALTDITSTPGELVVKRIRVG